MRTRPDRRHQAGARQLLRAAAGGRLLALRVVIVLVLLMAAQAYDGSLHALSHWIILGLYAVGAVGFGLLERGEGARAEAFGWAGTVLNATIAVYVIVEHMLAGASAVDDASDAVSRLPAFLLLLQTGLTTRVWHTVLFSGLVVLAWGAAIALGMVWPEGVLGPHVTLADQIPGLLTFAAASLVVIDGVMRLRGAVAEALRLEHERAQLARFVPDRVARDLARLGEAAAVRERHACLMAVDIRGFSRLTREAPQEAVVRALLAVRALVHGAVTEHDGIVDKYVGDGVLAQFLVGRPAEQAARALACAGAIQAGLAALGRERQAAGQPPLRVAVALHAGEVLVGVFDDGLRAEFTVLGPAMNTLARLEARAKAADLAVAASADFLALLPPAERARATAVEAEAAAGPILYGLAAGR
ncbi:adenylate/guanylate cyclase domain-containing protein [Methylobacterium sp. A54F]